MTYKNSEEMRKETHKGRLKTPKNKKFTCFDCKNQTFILVACADFPFFDAICSKCGSVMILPAG